MSGLREHLPSFVRSSTLLLSGALLGSVVALAVSGSVGARPSPRVPALGGGGEPVERPRSAHDDALAILRRNAFDSVTGRLDGDDRGAGAGAPGPPVAPVAPIARARCDGPHRLVATVAGGNAGPSFALVAASAGGATLVRPGMTLGELRVLRVAWDRVELVSAAGAPCLLPMWDRAPSGASAAASPDPSRGRVTVRPATPGTSAVDPMSELLERHVRPLGPGAVEVDRSLLDRLLHDRAATLRLARVSPYVEDGRTVGMRLHGLRRSGALARLGLLEGDVLRTVNGYDVTRPDAVLEALGRLPSADHVSIHLLRDGRPTQLEVAIR